MSATLPTDEMLLQLVAIQDVSAMEQLYDRHASFVYNVTFRIVKDAIVAEGILQETFLQVWQKANHYTGVGKGAAWVYRIARNKSLDHLRRTRVRPQSVITAVEDFLDLRDHNTPIHTIESDLQERECHTQLQTALAQLPREQSVCIRLAFFDGLSHHQISDQTGTPLGTVKTRIRLGLKKMTNLLNAQGIYRYEEAM